MADQAPEMPSPWEILRNRDELAISRWRTRIAITTRGERTGVIETGTTETEVGTGTGIETETGTETEGETDAGGTGGGTMTVTGLRKI